MPPSSSTPALDPGLQRLEVADVRCDGYRFAPSRLDQLHGLCELGFGPQGVGDRLEISADVDGDDVGALLGQRDGVAAALPARGPGDDGNHVVEFTHDYTSSVVPVSCSAKATSRAAVS